MRNKKVLIVSISILLIGVLGVFGYKQVIKARAVEGSKQIVVTVTNANANYTKEHHYETLATDLGTAFEEMKIVDVEEGSYGRFLVGADGYKADESKQEWWRVVVNGKDAETGIDMIMLNDGDRFEVVLMTGW